MKQITLLDLAMRMKPITPDTKVEHVADLFLQSEYAAVLSIPVVENGLPVGVVSRYRFMEIYLKPFGRDLFGKEQIGSIMHQDAVTVDSKMTLEAAARFITDNQEIPVKDDFIITHNREYYGTGAVMGLLNAMEEQLGKRTRLLQKAYKQLKFSQVKLVQSEKMASIGQMVAGVAHEINTPLGYVRNNVELSQTIIQQTDTIISKLQLFLKQISGGEASEAQLDNILLEVSQELEEFKEDRVFEEIASLTKDSIYGLDQIAEIVMNLKNFSRVDRAKQAATNINECMDSALIIGNNAIKHKAKVHRNYSELPQVYASPSQLNQVFLNLLTNAAQAIEKSGEIFVKTWDDTTNVYISIRDTGQGIAKASLKKIFDPFYTTKKIGEGTGLGLTICYQIIRDHGGGIKVKSKLGEGTEFIIKLPIQKESEQNVAPDIALPEAV